MDKISLQIHLKWIAELVQKKIIWQHELLRKTEHWMVRISFILEISFEHWTWWAFTLMVTEGLKKDKTESPNNGTVMCHATPTSLNNNLFKLLRMLPVDNLTLSECQEMPQGWPVISQRCWMPEYKVPLGFSGLPWGPF